MAGKVLVDGSWWTRLAPKMWGAGHPGQRDGVQVSAGVEAGGALAPFRWMSAAGWLWIAVLPPAALPTVSCGMAAASSMPLISDRSVVRTLRNSPQVRNLERTNLSDVQREAAAPIW